MKTSALGLAALLVVGGLSVPAFAASEDSSFDSDFLVTQLQHKGINATDVYENADNVIRAVVQQADGSSTFEYFYQDTLTPVKAAVPGQTRVLSKVDTGAKKVPANEGSLLVDNFFD